MADMFGPGFESLQLHKDYRKRPLHWSLFFCVGAAGAVMAKYNMGISRYTFKCPAMKPVPFSDLILTAARWMVFTFGTFFAVLTAIVLYGLAFGDDNFRAEFLKSEGSGVSLQIIQLGFWPLTASALLYFGMGGRLRAFSDVLKKKEGEIL